MWVFSMLVDFPICMFGKLLSFLLNIISSSLAFCTCTTIATLLSCNRTTLRVPDDALNFLLGKTPENPFFRLFFVCCATLWLPVLISRVLKKSSYFLVLYFLFMMGFAKSDSVFMNCVHSSLMWQRFVKIAGRIRTQQENTNIAKFLIESEERKRLLL